MAPLLVRSAHPTDFLALRPMLLDMGFVEDEERLAERFPTFCGHPDFGFFVAVGEGERLLGYALVQDYGPHLRSGNSHRTAKLHDLYAVLEARRQGVARTLMHAVEE